MATPASRRMGRHSTHSKPRSQKRALRRYSLRRRGAKTDRKARQKALAALEPGDVLLVTRLDRLAKSILDLPNTLDAVAKAGAGSRSLADAWADTTMPHGKLMLTILGGLAEFERSLILTRTGEGRARAMARGVGRKHTLTPHQQQEAVFDGPRTPVSLALAGFCRPGKANT
jgi:DNA invertase Pin-like site-specific DNA recombinase